MIFPLPVVIVLHFGKSPQKKDGNMISRYQVKVYEERRIAIPFQWMHKMESWRWPDRKSQHIFPVYTHTHTERREIAVRQKCSIIIWPTFGTLKFLTIVFEAPYELIDNSSHLAKEISTERTV